MQHQGAWTTMVLCNIQCCGVLNHAPTKKGRAPSPLAASTTCFPYQAILTPEVPIAVNNQDCVQYLALYARTKKRSVRPARWLLPSAV